MVHGKFLLLVDMNLIISDWLYAAYDINNHWQGIRLILDKSSTLNVQL